MGPRPADDFVRQRRLASRVIRGGVIGLIDYFISKMASRPENADAPRKLR
jgi:hypothetical protein